MKEEVPDPSEDVGAGMHGMDRWLGTSGLAKRGPQDVHQPAGVVCVQPVAGVAQHEHAVPQSSDALLILAPPLVAALLGPHKGHPVAWGGALQEGPHGRLLIVLVHLADAVQVEGPAQLPGQPNFVTL